MDNHTKNSNDSQEILMTMTRNSNSETLCHLTPDQNCNLQEPDDSYEPDCCNYNFGKTNSTVHACGLTKAYKELQLKLQTERKLFSVHRAEFASELTKVIEERDNLKAALMTAAKDRDSARLKCQELEQQVSAFESAEKERLEFKKTRAANTNADLKQLGLSEDILLSLPFGYATKIRSAFEKLDYENAKLRESLEQARRPATPNDELGCGQEAMARLDKMVREKEELLIRMTTILTENNLTLQALQDVRQEAKVHAKMNQEVLQLVTLLSKEVAELRDALRNCKTQSNIAEESLQGLPYDELRVRCSLLSRINTNMLQNNRLSLTQTSPVDADVGAFQKTSS